MSQDFVIAALPLVRGVLALCPLPRDAADWAQIADFAPDLVISMTEGAEMAALGAAELPRRVAALPCRWRGFPVADFALPPADADWPALARTARATLDTGGRVLVHCRGGLGRSGMVALRLMIAAGEAPDAALARLRAARPGAVETAAQLAWARQPTRP